jgi:hypothetical protein
MFQRVGELRNDPPTCEADGAEGWHGLDIVESQPRRLVVRSSCPQPPTTTMDHWCRYCDTNGPSLWLIKGLAPELDTVRGPSGQNQSRRALKVQIR